MPVRVHLGKLTAFTGIVGDFGLLIKRGILGSGTNTTIDDNGLAVSLSGVERVRVGAIGAGDYGLKVSASDGQALINGNQVVLTRSTGTIPAGVGLGISQTAVTADGVKVSTGGVDRVTMGAIGGGDYGLKVVNSGSTVIIDGTSNVFKIAATGTQNTGSVTDPGSASVSTTLTGLGTLAETPAHITIIANGTGNGVNRHLAIFQTTPWVNFYASATSGGPVNAKFLGLTCWAEGHTALSGGQAVVRLSGWTSGAGNLTFYQKYYVLKEAAL